MICGQKLNDQGALAPTKLNRAETLKQIREQLSQPSENNEWGVWGRWFLADSSTRTISPFSKITVPEWIKRQFDEATVDALAELEQLAISTGDRMLLERVGWAMSQAVESAEAARALEEWSPGASSGQAGSLNALAWLFAASPREDLRSGPIAVILAERAAAATSRKDPMILDTLAAGLAEAGRFDEAVRVQREALGLLNDAKGKEDYGSRLKLYKSNAPCRDPTANELAPTADDRLGMAALLRARGTLCAQFAQWTLAAGELTKAIALNPDEHWNWYQLAPLLLETGDAGGYRKHCHSMLARFGTTNTPPIAERTAKVCLLLPLNGADLAAASNLAETALTLGKDDPRAAYYQFAKGLAEYRKANFAQAAEWTQKALRRASIDHNRDVQACSVLAMALHRLNKAGEAHEALSEAAEIAGAKLPRLDSGDLGPAWHDWIIAQTLLREAQALIDGKTK
jgi:tetratricopeptide (TPR) repeat protein